MESPEPQSPWYQGSVAEAVQTANANGTVLLVCVVQGKMYPGQFNEGSCLILVSSLVKLLTLFYVKLLDNVPESDSGRFEARFRKELVLTTLIEENLVSLKLVRDTPDGMMFGQICMSCHLSWLGVLDTCISHCLSSG